MLALHRPPSPAGAHRAAPIRKTLSSKPSEQKSWSPLSREFARPVREQVQTQLQPLLTRVQNLSSQVQGCSSQLRAHTVTMEERLVQLMEGLKHDLNGQIWAPASTPTVSSASGQEGGHGGRRLDGGLGRKREHVA